MTLKDENGLD